MNIILKSDGYEKTHKTHINKLIQINFEMLAIIMKIFLIACLSSAVIRYKHLYLTLFLSRCCMSDFVESSKQVVRVKLLLSLTSSFYKINALLCRLRQFVLHLETVFNKVFVPPKFLPIVW